MNQNKQVQVLVGILAILLVIGSIALFYYQKNRYSDVFFEYNGFDVHRLSEKGIDEYNIKIFINNDKQPFQISSRYNPKDLEGIPVYGGLKEDLVGDYGTTKERLYITLDPDLTGRAVIAFSEINRYLENPFLFNIPTYPGFLRAVEGNEIEVINCGNVSSTVGVVRFDIGESNKIYSEDGCIIVEATDEGELIKVADRLTLTALGVMKP